MIKRYNFTFQLLLYIRWCYVIVPKITTIIFILHLETNQIIKLSRRLCGTVSKDDLYSRNKLLDIISGYRQHAVNHHRWLISRLHSMALYVGELRFRTRLPRSHSLSLIYASNVGDAFSFRPNHLLCKHDYSSLHRAFGRIPTFSLHWRKWTRLLKFPHMTRYGRAISSSIEDFVHQ